MPAWSPTGNFLLPQNIDERSTTAKTALGTRLSAKHATYGSVEFQYQKGVASGAVRDWVTINEDDGTVTRLAANAIGPVGIIMSTLTASFYGWVARRGKVLGNCLTLYADNAKVWITGTAGSVDDTSVAGDLVVNAKGASLTAVGSGYAEFEIDNPWVNDRMSGS